MNALCPCCKIAEEQDCHVLTSCAHTTEQFRKTLRQEVVDILKEHANATAHDTLQRELPAWFSCGDNNIRTTAHSHPLLKQIEQYDKHLGSLAYIPSALVKWLRELNCWKNNQQLVDALTQIQLLLVKRAHEAWIERCKVFEEQWRERCKQVKEREARAKEAAAKAKAEAAKAAKEEEERKQQRERQMLVQREQQQRQRTNGSMQWRDVQGSSAQASSRSDETREATTKRQRTTATNNRKLC